MTADGISSTGMRPALRQPTAYESAVNWLNQYISFTVSVNSRCVFCNSNVTFSANETECTGSVIFLFTIKEIRSWKSSFVDRSVRGLCSTDLNVWTLITMNQIWRFWFGRQREPWSIEKVYRRSIGAVPHADHCHTLSYHIETFEADGRGSKVNWVPYELIPWDTDRRFCTCELLLQRQRRKHFFASYHQW